MAQGSTFSEWYTRPPNATGSWSSTVAEEAFLNAKTRFENDLTKDPRKVAFSRSVSTLEDVQDVVQRAMNKYNASRDEGKARKWLVKLSQRIHFYSSILDVFAQHHPEYVALAWGSMKFLLMAVLNHEHVIATLAKAIAEIAWNLPRVELHTLLYPTDQMKEAVTNLYAYILRFLIRARDWYDQGGFHRFVHSITRPVELRYRDLLDEITNYSLIIDKLAISGSQAEIRDLHQKFSDSLAKNKDMSQKLSESLAENKNINRKLEMMFAMLEGLKVTVSLQSTMSIDTNHRMQDVQYHLSMNSLPSVSILLPEQSYKYHYSLKRQRSRSATVYAVPDSFWRSQKLQNWSHTNDSAMMMVTGGFQARFALRDLCVGIIDQLYQAKVPVVFAMKVPHTNNTSEDIVCTVDVLKYLARQILDTQQELQTEKSMAINHARFQDATTEKEWFQIVEALLSKIRGQIYIIIDLDLLDRKSSSSSSSSDFSWAQAFQAFFDKLSERGSPTKVKVLFVSYGILPFQLTAAQRFKYLVHAKVQLVTPRQRRLGRAPHSNQRDLPLRSLPGSSKRGMSTAASRRRIQQMS